MRAHALPLAMAIAVCALLAAAAFVLPVGSGEPVQESFDIGPTGPRPTFAVPTATVAPTTTAAPTTITTGTTAPPPPPSAPQPTSAVPRIAAATAPAPVAPPPQQLPLPYGGSADQVITVAGASSSSTTAQLTAWTRSGNGWARAIGPITAYVGSAGIGQASETTRRTPAGVFGLTEAFGIQADNGTRLPYRRVDTSDWWVSDVNSDAYNTHYRCSPGTCPFDEAAGENLGSAGTAYNHAVVIDYNRFPVTPGAGSAFFLHVSTGRATAGCVAIPSASLDTVMRWLDPAQHPVITIGIT